jgi:hypothetical protein
VRTNRILALVFSAALIAACGDAGTTQLVEFPVDGGASNGDDSGGCTCFQDSGNGGGDSSNTGDTGTGNGDDSGSSSGSDSGSSGGHDAGTRDGGSSSGGGTDSGSSGGGQVDSGSSGEGQDSGSSGGGQADSGNGDDGGSCEGDRSGWSCGHAYGCCVSDCAHDCHQAHPNPSCPVGQDCFKQCQAQCEQAKDECDEHDGGRCQH